MSNIEFYDGRTAIEVADGVYHLGVQDAENIWANIPYLVVDGDEAVLIDPGSAKPAFFEIVLNKIKGVVDPGKITHVVVQHQDPDLCAALPLFEPLVHEDCAMHAPLEARLLIQHYGLGSDILTLDDDDTLEFGDGRTLSFAMTPYCHFVGSMVTYDRRTRTLFSSDAFGGFTESNRLFAGDDYPAAMSTFLGEYLGSKRALIYALKRIEQIRDSAGIDLICPQHGCVIPKDQIASYLDAAHALEVGGLVDALARKHGIDLSEVL